MQLTDIIRYGARITTGIALGALVSCTTPKLDEKRGDMSVNEQIEKSMQEYEKKQRREEIKLKKESEAAKTTGTAPAQTAISAPAPTPTPHPAPPPKPTYKTEETKNAFIDGLENYEYVSPVERKREPYVGTFPVYKFLFEHELRHKLIRVVLSTLEQATGKYKDIRKDLNETQRVFGKSTTIKDELPANLHIGYEVTDKTRVFLYFEKTGDTKFNDKDEVVNILDNTEHSPNLTSPCNRPHSPCIDVTDSSEVMDYFKIGTVSRVVSSTANLEFQAVDVDFPDGTRNGFSMRLSFKDHGIKVDMKSDGGYANFDRRTLFLGQDVKDRRTGIIVVFYGRERTDYKVKKGDQIRVLEVGEFSLPYNFPDEVDDDKDILFKLHFNQESTGSGLVERVAKLAQHLEGKSKTFCRLYGFAVAEALERYKDGAVKRLLATAYEKCVGKDDLEEIGKEYILAVSKRTNSERHIFRYGSLMMITEDRDWCGVYVLLAVDFIKDDEKRMVKLARACGQQTKYDTENWMICNKFDQIKDDYLREQARAGIGCEQGE